MSSWIQRFVIFYVYKHKTFIAGRNLSILVVHKCLHDPQQENIGSAPHDFAASHIDRPQKLCSLNSQCSLATGRKSTEAVNPVGQSLRHFVNFVVILTESFWGVLIDYYLIYVIDY